MTKINKQDLRIIYMATADFALPSLQALVEGGYNVCAVVTMPDKAAGRGMKLRQSSIKTYALEQGLEVLQPEKLRDEAFVARLRELTPDLGIVVAFRMLPEVVWQLPRYGTINLHGSLLPRYRGAAPIHWAVIHGDEETGVSTFRLKHELDTGDILLQARMPISPTDTVGSVHDRMMHLGAETLLRTIDLFLEGEPQALPQDDSPLTPSAAPKLTRENTEINWARPASELYNFVRGLTPFPCAWASLSIAGGETLQYKILETEARAYETAEEAKLPIGSILLRGKKAIDVVTSEGVLRLICLQPPGKRAMTAAALLNGLRS